jgi:hypothetical protein
MKVRYICLICLEELDCDSKHCDRDPVELALFLADTPGHLAQREHLLKQKKSGDEDAKL